jgi:hypothetical protein
MSGREGWVFILFFYMAAAGIAAIFIVVPIKESGSVWRVLRTAYPLFLLTLFYKAAETQIFLIFDRPFDPLIHSFEKAIFGRDPAFAIQPYMEIWLNEIMNLAYLSFYLLIPAAFLILYFGRRWEAIERLALSAAVASYICLVVFILFPTAGPRFFLRDYYYLPMIGPFFTPIADIMAGSDTVRGAAFPSSHCALGLTVTCVIWGEHRKIGIILSVLLLLICVGSVYGRYTFVSGVIAGIITGWIGLWLSGRWRPGISNSELNDPDRVSSEKTGSVSR